MVRDNGTVSKCIEESPFSDGRHSWWWWRLPVLLFLLLHLPPHHQHGQHHPSCETFNQFHFVAPQGRVSKGENTPQIRKLVCARTGSPPIPHNPLKNWRKRSDLWEFFSIYARKCFGSPLGLPKVLYTSPHPEIHHIHFKHHGATSVFDVLFSRISGLPNLFGVCVYSFMCHHSLPSLVSSEHWTLNLTVNNGVVTMRYYILLPGHSNCQQIKVVFNPAGRLPSHSWLLFPPGLHWHLCLHRHQRPLHP